MGLGCLRENIVAAGGEPGGRGRRGGPARAQEAPSRGGRVSTPAGSGPAPRSHSGLRAPTHTAAAPAGGGGGGPSAPSFPKGGVSRLGRPGLGLPQPLMETPRLPPPPREGGRLPAQRLSTAGGGRAAAAAAPAGGGLRRALPGRPYWGERGERPPYGGAEGPSGRGPAAGGRSPAAAAAA